MHALEIHRCWTWTQQRGPSCPLWRPLTGIPEGGSAGPESGLPEVCVAGGMSSSGGTGMSGAASPACILAAGHPKWDGAGGSGGHMMSLGSATRYVVSRNCRRSATRSSRCRTTRYV